MLAKTARIALLSTVLAVTVSSMPAFAGERGFVRFRPQPSPCPPARSVPEIDAGSGLAAAAALFGALALAWERRRVA